MLLSLRRTLPILALTAACGGDGGPDNTPASIALTPSAPITLASGATSTISARVLNKGGNPVTGSPVSWTSSDPNVATVSAGQVTAARVGTTTITASTGTATTGSASASINVTVTPGAASQLAVRTQPIGATIGTPLATQPVVEVRDAAGNLVPTSTATVTAAIADGGGTLIGQASVAAVSGVATFTGLAVSGVAGPRSLSFASAGLSTATSARFTITPPPTPIIVLDTTALSFAIPRTTTLAPRIIGITNGGFAPLATMAVEPIQYDAGQSTGWLNAVLSAPTAPATLTLTFAAATLAEGTYRATVRIAAAEASNSPASLVVTLTVNPNYTLTFGSNAEKTRILEIGSAFAPSISLADERGPVPGVQITYTSRASSVATVAADGRITAGGEGDAWIVARAPFAADSVFVVVPRAGNGPVLRTNVTTWLTRIGDTLSATVVLDTRSTPVGAASLAVDLQIASGNLTVLTSIPSGPPVPIVNQASAGVYRISVGAASGLTGSVSLLNFKFVSRFVTTAWLALVALDVSGVDASNLTPASTSTRIPLVFR